MDKWKAMFDYLRREGHKFNEWALREFVVEVGWVDSPSTRRVLERLVAYAPEIAPTNKPAHRGGHRKAASEAPKPSRRRPKEITEPEWLRARTVANALVRRILRM